MDQIVCNIHSWGKLGGPDISTTPKFSEPHGTFLIRIFQVRAHNTGTFHVHLSTHVKCECHISNVIQIWNKLSNDVAW